MPCGETQWHGGAVQGVMLALRFNLYKNTENCSRPDKQAVFGVSCHLMAALPFRRLFFRVGITCKGALIGRVCYLGQ